LTQTAIFKNASEKWRCEQSDSFYQNFVFGATGQIARSGANHDCKSNCARLKAAATSSRATAQCKFKGNVKDAGLKAAANLRFGSAESQDESRCGAIHKVKCKESAGRPSTLPLADSQDEPTLRKPNRTGKIAYATASPPSA
jgi:hypothetical protein